MQSFPGEFITSFLSSVQFSFGNSDRPLVCFNMNQPGVFWLFFPEDKPIQELFATSGRQLSGIFLAKEAGLFPTSSGYSHLFLPLVLLRL